LDSCVQVRWKSVGTAAVGALVSRTWLEFDDQLNIGFIGYSADQESSADTSLQE